MLCVVLDDIKIECIVNSYQDLQRRISDFCTEVWNLWQRWEELNGKGYRLLEMLVNNRLQIEFSRKDSESVAPYSREMITSNDQQQDKKVIHAHEVGDDRAVFDLEYQKIMESIVRHSEELTDILEEMKRVRDKFQSAADRLSGFIKLTRLPENNPDMTAVCIWKMREMEEILPCIVKMFRNEFDAKKAALYDLGHLNSRNPFLAIIASWTHQPFIDRSLLNRLYALVA